MDEADLDNRFAYHQPSTPSVAENHGNIRDRCRDLAAVIDAAAVDCREKSLAITALEEAMLWANAAIARHQ